MKISKFWVIMFFAAWAIGGGFAVVWSQWPSTPAELSSAALMGDFIGGWLASCVALASTVLFFGAVMLQRDELAATREQLKLSLKEMEMARAVHQEQARHLEEQTRIAQHSAVMARLLDTIKRYHEAVDDYFHARESADVSALQFTEVGRRCRELGAYIHRLLGDPALSVSDGDHLRRIANLPDESDKTFH